MELAEYINIICLGDSNTAGNGLTTKQTYPALLQGRYFEHNVGVVNKGVSGNKVADIVARLTNDVYANKITGARNIVALNIGVNDAISLGTPASTIYNNIVNTLIIPLKDNGFEVWLCTLPSFTSSVSGLAIVKSLNTLILSDENADKIIDLYARTVDTTDTIIAGIVQADGLHLTEIGTNICSGLLANELNT